MKQLPVDDASLDCLLPLHYHDQIDALMNEDVYEVERLTATGSEFQSHIHKGKTVHHAAWVSSGDDNRSLFSSMEGTGFCGCLTEFSREWDSAEEDDETSRKMVKLNDLFEIHPAIDSDVGVGLWFERAELYQFARRQWRRRCLNALKCGGDERLRSLKDVPENKLNPEGERFMGRV